MSKSNKAVSLLALIWCMAGVGASAGAMAQTSTPAATSAATGEPRARDAGSFGEIIVTAQKREQRLNDVGISIVAATADQLQTAGVSDPTMLAKITPGFSYARTIHGYNVFSIRGVNFNASQLSAAPTVSSYVDEAALPYASMTQAMLLDVDHVEILKGPQGTLFGQNATGGSVNAIAAKPTADLSTGVEATVNHFGQVAVNGYISGPLSETFRARLAFSTTQFGEWQKGYYLSDRRIGDQNKSAARLLLEWTPTETLKISANINGSYDKGEPQAQQLHAVAAQNPAGALPALLTYAPTPRSNRASDVNIIPKNDDYMVQGVLRADWEVSDNITLTSITNGIRNRHKIDQDGDANALNIVELRVLGKVKSFSQELRLTGAAEDIGLNYIIGGNYQKDRFFEQQLPNLNNYSSLPPTNFNSFYNQANRSTAIFGNVDWEFVPGLTLTAGARRTWTRQATNGCTADTGDGTSASFFQTISDIVRGAQGLAPVPGAFKVGECATFDNSPSADGTLPFLPTRIDLSQKEKNVSWRAGLNYKPQQDILLYGLVSRGYKNGVFPVTDTIVSSQIRPVRQEELTAYEAGAKVDLMNRKLHIEAAVFHYDYVDKQFFSFQIAPFVGQASTLINIPMSKATGFEFSTVVRPVEGLSLSGGVTFVDSKIGNFQGVDVTGASVDFTGKSFNFAPRWSSTGDAEYRFPVNGDLDAYFGGNMMYNSHTYSDLANSAISKVPSYATFDARIGVESQLRWRASLWVRNLTDKFYWTAVGTGADILFRYTGQPRTFGATFGVKF